MAINPDAVEFQGYLNEAFRVKPSVHSNTPLINIDKAKQAFASSTLCQHTFFKPGTEVNPHMLCAVSAMVVYAGMTPELWSTLVTDALTLWQYARPILAKQYNIPASIAERIPRIFDHESNEWRAVEAVLAEFDRYNKTILHAQAIEEDARRFPQLGPAGLWTDEISSYIFRPSIFDSVVAGDLVKTPSAAKSLTEQEQILDAMAAKKRKLEKAASLKAMWLSNAVNIL